MTDYIVGGNIFMWLFWGIMLIGIIWHVCSHESFLKTDIPDHKPPPGDSLSKV